MCKGILEEKRINELESQYKHKHKSYPIVLDKKLTQFCHDEFYENLL